MVEEVMTEQEMQERIEVNLEVMAGKPVIRGTRLTVEHVLSMLAHGATASDILAEYEGVTEADIQACLLFASRSLEDMDFMPLRQR
jgi:uncharacterized protein (DUF433 family)